MPLFLMLATALCLGAFFDSALVAGGVFCGLAAVWSMLMDLADDVRDGL